MSRIIRNRGGMALVLTLMVVAILTAAVVEFAYGVYVSTSSLHNWRTSQSLSVAARSAVRLGSRLIAENSAQHPGYTYPGSFEMSQKMPFEEIEGTVTIKIEDENAKFNLNTIRGQGFTSDKDYGYNGFKRMLEALQLNPEIADRVSYWMDASSDHRPADGRAATKNARLDSVDELLLIPGIDAATYGKLRPYVTIYSSDNSINVNTASLPVLMSLPDMTPEKAQDIIEKRPYRSNLSIIGTGCRATAYAVIATAESNDIKRIVEAVLGSDRKVNYWKEL